MDEALAALQDSDSNGELPPVADSDAPAIVGGSDPDHNPAGVSDGWGSGGFDAALLAIRGHRFSQRGDKLLRQARSAKQSC